eukprot:comp18298_c0_seq1/m.19342 comp18298_c0_seq1/g.19342  ORF comp18298_c0_seq1/g.19342 comp18298_c0_seq1/m.19342 type:complete len:664 (-) comp18298_c0_seq1:915-2906(-)
MTSNPREDHHDGSDDESLVEDLMREAPQMEDGLQNVVAVDNVPQVPQEKVGKLVTVLTKLFSKLGPVREPIFMPMDANGQSKGFCFIEFANPEHAMKAVETLNGYKLDKAHTFEVIRMTDLEKFANITDEFVEPASQPQKEPVDLHWWLTDERCFDQFALRYDVHTAVKYNTRSEPEDVHHRENWTETYVVWSPKGSYLATFHRKGIALWAGPEFTQVMRFPHTGVKLIDFSPCEKYIVTWSNEVPDDPRDPQSIIVWDVRTGRKLRGFGAEEQMVWPAFKWSNDDQFFARTSADTLSIYETPSMKLMDKKSIKIENIRDFAWSPSENYIAYWVSEHKEQPARVVILDVGTKAEIRVKNLFNVKECKLHWQNKGDFLCVKVERHTKTKKSTFTNFEIFRLREKQVPVDNVEFKDQLHAFAWEPAGDKFAIIHGETGKLCVSFYQMQQGKEGGKVAKLHTAEKKTVNHLFWSPKGRYIVLAGLRNMQGVLEFWDTTENLCMNTGEHFMATDVEWDPTGRYVATSVSYWRHQMENGYKIWSFQGRQLYNESLEKFYQFIWRPRPPTLLTDDEIKAVRKNLKTYSIKFDQEDLISGDKASKEQIEKRRKQWNDYQEFRKRSIAEYKERREERIAIRDGQASEDEGDTLDDEEVVELFIEEKVEVIN